MLATFVIGLREGLEAALIVGIIAAFLRRNGRPLTAMWIGVTAAIALSIGVGVTLAAIEQALPQAAQEGMEAIIGVVAVFFVTGMIVWMNQHSRAMKSDLEEQAGEALRDGHAYALAVMAFLAVLKEGFETSVFLLATFTASSNTALAVIGAFLGVVVAVGIGIGIYAGGVRLNLSRFFRITGVFLILVAAGLVVTTLRTAHEAGWIVAGQQQVADLSWLVRPGSITAALLTGVLGVPADPRLIEVVGWVLYVVPVALYVYWPRAHRARGRAVARLQASIGVACLAAAAALAIAFAVPPATAPRSIAITAQGEQVGTATLTDSGIRIALTGAGAQSQPLRPADARQVQHAGVSAQEWTWTAPVDGADVPDALTVDQLAALNGGRLPIGINPAQQTGPFTAQWHATLTRTAWTSEDTLLDVSQSQRAIVTLSGGGLATPRTVTVSGTDPAHPDSGAWAADAARVQHQVQLIDLAAAHQTERALWGIQIPIALSIAAVVLFVFAARSRRREQAASQSARPQTTTPRPTPAASPRSSIHVTD